MATAESLTPEALAQKAQQIREANRTEGADHQAPTISVPVFERETSTTCARCKISFIYRAMMMDGHKEADDGPTLGGREIGTRSVCDDCINKEKANLLALDAKQAGYASRLEGRDRETALMELLEQMGANPWDHGAAHFDRFDIAERGPKALGAAREFAAAVKEAGRYDPVRSLYLHGDTGTDKTDLCVAIVKWLIENDFPPKGIVFDNAAELIARIQDTYGRKEASTMEVLEKRFNASLWILDDFGTERASDDVLRHLTLIFTKRGMRPNLVTSNYSPEQLDSQRPEFFRVLSRLGPKYFRTAALAGRDRRFD